jgi:tetratricopeptide (TPR) repeat protein
VDVDAAANLESEILETHPITGGEHNNSLCINRGDERNLKRYSPIRIGLIALAAAMAFSLGQPWLRAQNQSNPKPAGQQDNPFPDDPAKAPAPQKPPTPDSDQKQVQTPATKPQSDNPFPGEETGAPIIPVDPGPGSVPPSGSTPSRTPAETAPGHPDNPDRDADPVRSPDPPGMTADDGFSSSKTGLNQMPVEDDSDARPGKSIKNKSRSETIKEDLEIGGFYMNRKNWKGAQGRFGSALALDPESPEAIWGLAEAERHLQLYHEAAEHYKMFLSYDPDGPHGHEARKALEQVEAADKSAPKTANPTISNPDNLVPK